jgi:chromosome partitioning protein
MIISVAGQKGGTGKSTVAICLAVELMRRAHAVLLLDADAQGTATTWRDLAVEMDRAVPDLARTLSVKDLDAGARAGASSHDHVIIDLPSDLKEITRAALVVSHVVIIPCGASATEMWSLTETVEVVQAARVYNPALKALVVQTRVQRGTRAGKSLRADLAPWGLTVLHQQIVQRVAYRDSVAAGHGVTSYPGAGDAGREFQDFVDELLQRIGGDHDDDK